MRSELLPAIEALKGEVTDLENKVAAARAMTNRMCELAGVAPVYPEAGVSTRAPADAARADLYYGKSVTTAARELLEARNAAGRGPALPREIYDGLVAGGLQFESESETTRLIGLRATLRKNSGIFHKLPNGQYGLLAWYPKVKASRSDEETGVPVPRRRVVPASSAKRRVKASDQRRVHKRSGKAVGSEFDEFAVVAMADGHEWTCAKLKQQAIEFGNVGVDDSTDLRSLNVRLLNLLRQERIARRGKGVWIARKETPASAGGVIHPFKGAA